MPLELVLQTLEQAKRTVMTDPVDEPQERELGIY